MQVEVCVQDCYTELEQPDSCTIASISDLPWEHWFEQWLAQLQPDLSPLQAYELSLRLTGDREMQALNAQYRQQDKSTDVLAFAALEADCPEPIEADDEPLYLGDIVISIDTAQKQAIAQDHPLQTELAWLASHGLLHLLGWDHPDETSLVAMLTQQKALLHTVGVSITDG
jgi:probable rRNA maturation factor